MEMLSGELTKRCIQSCAWNRIAGELPARDERARLMIKINYQPLLDLIQRCLKEKWDDRPNASDIISELDV